LDSTTDQKHFSFDETFSFYSIPAKKKDDDITTKNIPKGIFDEFELEEMSKSIKRNESDNTPPPQEESKVIEVPISVVKDEPPIKKEDSVLDKKPTSVTSTPNVERNKPTSVTSTPNVERKASEVEPPKVVDPNQLPKTSAQTFSVKPNKYISTSQQQQHNRKASESDKDKKR